MSITLAGRLADCLLLSYRTPADTVAGLLPRGLELVSRGRWAFWNVVVCRVESLRPAGVPHWCGITYHHVAYRLLVRAVTGRLDVRRGLYFVRSDVDSLAAGILGSWLSDLHPHPARITLEPSDDGLSLRVAGTTRTTGDAELVIREDSPVYETGSCFPTARDAAEFLRYEPLGLAVEGDTLTLTRVERPARDWSERPVTVASARWSFFESMGQHDLQLELATRVAPIDYRWILGQREGLLVGQKMNQACAVAPLGSHV